MTGGGAHAPVLEVRGLTVDFPAGRVLDDVSFALHRDQTLAIVGESGSGKSMTALSIMRLLPPRAVVSGGSVTLRGGVGQGAALSERFSAQSPRGCTPRLHGLQW